MKYKVGDKVKVRSDLKCEEYYGGVPFTSEMNRFKGMEFTIARVNNGGYYEVLEALYNFTNEMFEPVKIIGNICEVHNECKKCPLREVRGEEYCMIGIGKNADKTLKIAEQWKEDHEKKPIETEHVMCIVVMDEKRNVVYEEKTNGVIVTTDMEEEVLKKYCSEHDGKYYAISERRCVVKE